MSSELDKILSDINFRKSLENDFSQEQLDNVVYDKYTLFQLYAAFELIKNKYDWKEVISTIIPTEDLVICGAACIYFTGGDLTVVRCGKQGTEVQSLGYNYHLGINDFFA